MNSGLEQSLRNKPEDTGSPRDAYRVKFCEPVSFEEWSNLGWFEHPFSQCLPPENLGLNGTFLGIQIKVLVAGVEFIAS